MKTKKLGAEAVQQERGGVTTLVFPRLADPKVLKHAFSTRLGGVSRGPRGSLNISYKVQDEPVRVDENRELLARALDMDLNRAVFVTQVHSEKVLKLDASNRPKAGEPLGEADGIITNEVQTPIMIMVADCLPILFFDPVHKAIGLAHAGWRGTVSHIAAKTLLSMSEAYGTKPEETRAVLGPAIGSCCYEVGPDVKAQFEEVFPWAAEVLEPSGTHQWKLDIAEANARQLLEIGMTSEHLIRSNLCTVANLNLVYSHRAEASEEQPTGRVGAFMMLAG